jgi:TIR domain/Sulfatase-modifying factor enzyme 1
MIAAAAAAVRGSIEPKARVFISYSRKDMDFVDRLDAALEARGYKPVIDRSEIHSLEDWWNRIQALIGKADTIIFVLSPDAISSSTCRKEVAFAASLNKRFAAVICRPVIVADVPSELSQLNFISFDDKTRFEHHADKLAEALSTDIEWIRKHTEFGELARHWREAGKPQGLLLRSPLLEAAESWIGRQPKGAPFPTGITRTFIVESRKAETIARARARRTKARVGALVGVFVLVLIGAGVGWWKQNWLKEQYQWHAVMGPSVLTTKQERALKRWDQFVECQKGCPLMMVVEITTGSPVAVAKFDVTSTEWDACVDAGACKRLADQSVTNVSFDEARGYAAWLSRLTGKEYRLVSEVVPEIAGPVISGNLSAVRVARTLTQ